MFTIDCDFTTGICPRCGQRGEPHWHANCANPPEPKPGERCRHLGAEVREQVCESCALKGKNVRAKVFVCAVHGECTMMPVGVGLKCCPCPQFSLQGS